MWKVKSREEIIVGKKEAEELWKFNVYKAQRTINQRHLEQIKRALKDNTFRTGSIAIVILKIEKNKKIKLLVNGQHQLKAIIDLDSMMISNFEEIECDTWEDVAEVYATYDQGGRGLYDLINPYADAHEIQWPATLTKKILGGGLYKDGRLNWDCQRKAASIHEYLKLGL
jgi:phosphotransferase system HPr-like phosphotransfer protein